MTSLSPTHSLRLSFREKIPFSTFSQKDRQVAFLLFGIALLTFWWTAMPNIGLSDDGEMGTAAIHFGVPHPSGYPLWTILAGIFNRLPFGNAAWKLNLFSGLSAATAIGIFGLISRNSSRWLGLPSKVATWITIPTTLIFAWSIPLWSQATIGKGTYSLHVLLMMILALFCYLWIRNPQWNNAFVWVVFSFSLGMSNHHMTLAMAALPLFVILLLHRDLFWEYALYSLAIASLIYIGFGVLSDVPEVIKASHRFGYLIIGGFGLFYLLKRGFLHWRQGVLLLLAVVLGLLPYLYMPLASSTNPPMNWSYTSTKAGFYYAINRSQYWGTLADQLQGTIGRVVGVPPAKKGVVTRLEQGESKLGNFLGFFQRFWTTLVRNITPLPLLAVFLALFFVYRRKSEEKIWLLLLLTGFFLSAFFEPIMAPMGYDNLGWDLQKPWQGLCYGFFILLAGYGLASLLEYWHSKSSSQEKEKKEKKLLPLPPKALSWIVAAWSLTALFTFWTSLPWSSQRGHWFGWMLGRDMLIDLPKGSILFGGTDQGRFIPTYMIFGESRERPCFKRDPHFDRRDLYIITQNALADTYYNHYIRSQYTAERPHQFNWVERLLARDKVYPQDNLLIPNEQDIIPFYQEEQARYQQNPSPINDPIGNPGIINSDVAEWIFLRNRDKHHFFVEESFEMPWSYKYAIPNGLCYEICHDPIPTIPAEAVKHDKEFWDNYMKKLQQTPGYHYDTAALHTFSKLRNTTGNLYLYRNMYPEAEYAYRQALELYPGSTETTQNLVKLLLKQKRYQDASLLAHQSLNIDPNCRALQQLVAQTDQLYQTAQETPQLLQEYLKTPNNMALLGNLLHHYQTLGEQQKIDQLVKNLVQNNPKNISLLTQIVNFYAEQKQFNKALALTWHLQELLPNDWGVAFSVAKYDLILGDQEGAFHNLSEAIRLGGNAAKQMILQEPLFNSIKGTAIFQEMIQAPFKKTPSS